MEFGQEKSFGDPARILEEQRYLGLLKKIESGIELSKTERIDYERLHPLYGLDKQTVKE